MANTFISRSLFALVILALTPFPSLAQNFGWAWAVSAGENELDIGRAVETDQSGNVYVTGIFNSSTITFGDFTLTSTASSNLFIVKYDEIGNVIWARASEGTGSVSCRDMVIDPDGNIYIAGFFSSLSLIFDNTTLVTQGSDDAFLVKYSPDGDVIYALNVGQSGSDKFLGITYTAAGNIYVTGSYDSIALDFGSITITNSNLWLNTFLAKYDPQGNAIWAIDIGGDGADWGRDVAAGSNGDVYLTGDHSSSTFSIGNLQLTNEDGPDLFIAKFDGNGNVLWAKRGVANGTSSLGIALDAADNAYITGSFGGNSIEFGNVMLTGTGPLSIFDFFIAKYNADGNEQWAKSGGGEFQEEGRDISVDQAGNIRATGYHVSPISTFGNFTITNSGSKDIFVLEYSPDGELNWILSAGGSGNDQPEDMANNLAGDIYITGFFDSPVLEFGSNVLNPEGEWDAFISKIGITVGINESRVATEFQLYPNPLQSNRPFQSDLQLNNATLIFQNLLGEKVFAYHQLNGLYVDALPQNIPAGIYIVQLIETGKVKAYTKVIVFK